MNNKKNSELPKLRVSTELKDEMEKVISKLNEGALGIEISMSAFRRMAYKSFLSELLSNGLTLNYKLES